MNKTFPRSPTGFNITLILAIIFTGSAGCYPPPLEPSPTATITPKPSITTSQNAPTTATYPLLPYSSSFQYTPTGLYPGESLMIYSEPSPDSTILGKLSVGDMPIFIQSNPITKESTTWIMIEYDQIEGYADASKLAIYEGELPPDLVRLGQTVLHALKDFNYVRIEKLIHPEHCLRFSPYPYLSDTNPILCPTDLLDASKNGSSTTWGAYDGTGDPINLTFREYHQKFVFDQDYTRAPILGFGVEVSSGNSINNIPDIFPDGKMIEYYFPEFDPQYGGLDWRSLRLVFINIEGTWYLSAIIHGEWTI